MERALSPTLPTLWTIERAHGWDGLLAIVTNVLAQVDVATGGDGQAGKCEMWASQLLTRPDVKGRSLSYLIVALREGIARYTVHDKRMGLEQLNKMLNDRDREILGQLPDVDEVGETQLRHTMEQLKAEDAEVNADRKRLRATIAELKERLNANEREQ